MPWAQESAGWNELNIAIVVYEQGPEAALRLSQAPVARDERAEQAVGSAKVDARPCPDDEP